MLPLRISKSVSLQILAYECISTSVIMFPFPLDILIDPKPDACVLLWCDVSVKNNEPNPFPTKTNKAHLTEKPLVAEQGSQ